MNNESKELMNTQVKELYTKKGYTLMETHRDHHFRFTL